jgi:serine/threonine protein kinase
VWALGCVLYSLLVGKLPFDGEDKVEQVYSILNKQLKFPSRIKSDPDLVDLLTRMLDRNPLRRITVDEALRHPWVSYLLLRVMMPDCVSVILDTCARVWSCGFVCIRRSRLSVQENQCAKANCDR